MVWTNDDGLNVMFGTEQGSEQMIGSPAQSGAYKVLVIDIDATKLNAHTVADDFFEEVPATFIPSGALIKSASLDVSTAFDSGGSATLDLGFLQADGTALDVDGIDATIAETAIDAVGDSIACDGALVGGAALTADAYPSYGVNTATFTVGKGKLAITYYVPA
jgi:hypothetical protein